HIVTGFLRAARAAGSWGVAGCRVPMWQRWHSIVSLATSIRPLEDPCASWQVVHFSETGACSHRNGPRFSAWHRWHDSLIVLPPLSRRTLVLPCGSWQLLQSIFPSRIG